MGWKDRAKEVGDVAPQSASSDHWSTRAKVVDPNAPIPDDKIIQEQAPEISWTDRLKTKNFSSGDDSTLDYYRQKNPAADVRMQNGQVLVRPFGESNYRVDDPNPSILHAKPGETLKNIWTNVKDIPADVGDVAWDVGDGIANGVASVGGALAGAFGGTAVAPGPGTVAGGVVGRSVGSGLESAASEAARQKIGQQLGLPQDVNGTDVALSGGIGAIMPNIFGAGAEAKSVAKAALGGQEVNALLRKAAGMDAAKELLSKRAALEAGNSVNRGAVQKGYDVATRTVAPWAAGLASGKGMQAIRELGQNMPFIDQLAGRKNGLAEEVAKASEDLGRETDSHLNKVGSALADEIHNTGQKINMVPAKQAMRAPIGTVEGLMKEDNSPVNATLLDKLKKAYSDMYGVKAPPIAEPEKPSFNPMTLSYDPVKEMPPVPTEMADQVSAGTAWNKQQQLKRVAKFEPMAQGVTTPDGTLVDDARLKNAAKDSYRAINDQFLNASGGKIPELKKDYVNGLSLETNLEPYFNSPKKTYSTLRGLDKDQNLYARQALDQAQEAGLPTAGKMQELRAAIPWVDPGWGSKSSVPLATAMGLGGAYLGAQGEGRGGSMVGGGLGVGAGILLASPKSVKAAVKMGLKSEAWGNKLKGFIPDAANSVPGGRNAAVKSLYDVLADQNRQNKP